MDDGPIKVVVAGEPAGELIALLCEPVGRRSTPAATQAQAVAPWGAATKYQHAGLLVASATVAFESVSGLEDYEAIVEGALTRASVVILSYSVSGSPFSTPRRLIQAIAVYRRDSGVWPRFYLLGRGLNLTPRSCAHDACPNAVCLHTPGGAEVTPDGCYVYHDLVSLLRAMDDILLDVTRNRSPRDHTGGSSTPRSVGSSGATSPRLMLPLPRPGSPDPAAQCALQ